MSSTSSARTAAPKSVEPTVFDHSVADLKQGMARAQAVMSEQAVETANAVSTFNQASLEAFAQAGEILAIGSQDLLRQMVQSNQEAIQETLSDIQKLMAAKTFPERLDLQLSLARSCGLRALAEGNRFIQAGFDLVERASVPLTDRASLAAKAFPAPKA
jgi:hypothetical protein